MNANLRCGSLYFYCSAVSMEVRQMTSNVKRIVLTGSLLLCRYYPSLVEVAVNEI